MLILVLDLIFFGSFFCSIITSLILFIYSERIKFFANKLLGVTIFSTAWYCLMGFLILSGLIIQSPYLYKIGTPLYYLIPPCTYIYIRSIVRGESKLRKSDWLHFVPALVMVINLFPYYFSEIENKQKIVNLVTGDLTMSYKLRISMLPPYLDLLFKPVQGICYVILDWYLMINLLLKDKSSLYRISAPIKRWLFTITWFHTILYIGLCITAIIICINWGNCLENRQENWFKVLMACVISFGLSIYLLFKPDFLYNSPKIYPEAVVGNINVQVDAVIGVQELKDSKSIIREIDPTHLEDLIKKLEYNMIEKKAFRKQGLTIRELASECEIPHHLLTYLLNRHYKQRFNDYINSYRIIYVREYFDKSCWKELSIEGVGRNAGFSSRTTFFIAFKKFTGMSPSEYLKNQNVDHDCQ